MQAKKFAHASTNRFCVLGNADNLDKRLLIGSKLSFNSSPRKQLTLNDLSVDPGTLCSEQSQLFHDSVSAEVLCRSTAREVSQFFKSDQKVTEKRTGS